MSSPPAEVQPAAVWAPASYAAARRAPQWKWNPFLDTPPQPLLASGLVAEDRKSIPDLVEMYHQQVAALVSSHEAIMFMKNKVEEAVNELRITSGSRSAEGPPSQLGEQHREVELLKQGLDIRLRQFAEDCHSASKLEWVLRRKISAAEDKTEKSLPKVTPAQVQPTCEALKKIQDQDRLIKLLQHVLDQSLYHNHVYAEKLRQMRKECFADELQWWGAIQDGAAWFESKEIDFRGTGPPRFGSTWMQLIRCNPKEDTVPPPPRVDPQSLCFVSRMHDIDQLSGALADKTQKYTTLSRQRDLKEIRNQLAQLRQVLSGAATAASGVEKVILKNVTATVDERETHRPRAVSVPSGETGEVQGVAAAGAASGDDTVAKAQGTSPAGGLALRKGPDTQGAIPAAPGASAVSESPRRQRRSSAPASSSGALASDVGRAEIRPVDAAAATDIIPKRQHSISSSASPPPLRRGASRTVPSPRQSFDAGLPRSQSGVRETTQGPTEDFQLRRGASRTVPSPRQSFDETLHRRQSAVLETTQKRTGDFVLRRGASRTVASPRQSFDESLPRSQSGIGEAAEKPTEDVMPSLRERSTVFRAVDSGEVRPASGSPLPSNAPISRASSRTLAGPRRTVSRASLTARSVVGEPPVLPSSPLSRAMSSAFLGG